MELASAAAVHPHLWETVGVAGGGGIRFASERNGQRSVRRVRLVSLRDTALVELLAKQLGVHLLQLPASQPDGLRTPAEGDVVKTFVSLEEHATIKAAPVYWRPHRCAWPTVAP